MLPTTVGVAIIDGLEGELPIAPDVLALHVYVEPATALDVTRFKV